MTEPKTRAAHTADVISAYTGRMVTMGNSLAGVARMLEFMIDRKLPQTLTDQGMFRFQLPRAAETVRPYLEKHIPWLENLTVPDVDDLSPAERNARLRVWRDQLIEEHGAVQRVPRIPEGVWEDKDPVTELKEMAPHMSIVPVMDTGYSVETFSHHRDGMFRNPRLSETGEDD